MGRPKNSKSRKPSREKLLEAAIKLIRTEGFNATTVDNLCEAAGVTKGTFFHYFENKEALGIAAAQHWSKLTSEFFKSAPYHQSKDPLDRFLGYVKFRKEILKGDLPDYTCLAGTMAQEVYSSNPEIGKACYSSMRNHAETLENDIQEAKKLYSPKSSWNPKSLALHTQAVIQGAFVLAKASGGAKVAEDSLDHLMRYIQLLFKK